MIKNSATNRFADLVLIPNFRIASKYCILDYSFVSRFCFGSELGRSLEDSMFEFIKYF